jgi:hypothetical protein
MRQKQRKPAKKESFCEKIKGRHREWKKTFHFRIKFSKMSKRAEKYYFTHDNKHHKFNRVHICLV